MEACVNTCAGLMLAICQFCFGQCISIRRERLIRLQIAVRSSKYKYWHHICSFNGSRCRMPPGNISWKNLYLYSECFPRLHSLIASRLDTWHPHVAAEAKGMMTSCLLLSERLKEDIDDKGWAQSAAMCLCAAVGDDTWRGAASCLSGLLWPVHNWWVEWIRDEFVTVSQPDGDGQSSSLALLIWLMMTMMVMMMMPVFLPQHCPGLCPGCASPLSSLLALLDSNTKIEGRARK